jgi:hypothetical protein
LRFSRAWLMRTKSAVRVGARSLITSLAESCSQAPADRWQCGRSDEARKQWIPHCCFGVLGWLHHAEAHEFDSDFRHHFADRDPRRRYESPASIAYLVGDCVRTVERRFRTPDNSPLWDSPKQTNAVGHRGSRTAIRGALAIVQHTA